MPPNFNTARTATSFSGEYFGYLEFPDFGEVMICPSIMPYFCFTCAIYGLQTFNPLYFKTSFLISS